MSAPNENNRVADQFGRRNITALAAGSTYDVHKHDLGLQFERKRRKQLLAEREQMDVDAAKRKKVVRECQQKDYEDSLRAIEVDLELDDVEQTAIMKTSILRAKGRGQSAVQIADKQEQWSPDDVTNLYLSNERDEPEPSEAPATEWSSEAEPPDAGNGGNQTRAPTASTSSSSVETGRHAPFLASVAAAMANVGRSSEDLRQEARNNRISNPFTRGRNLMPSSSLFPASSSSAGPASSSSSASTLFGATSSSSASATADRLFGGSSSASSSDRSENNDGAAAPVPKLPHFGPPKFARNAEDDDDMQMGDSSASPWLGISFR